MSFVALVATSAPARTCLENSRRSFAASWSRRWVWRDRELNVEASWSALLHTKCLSISFHAEDIWRFFSWARVTSKISRYLEKVAASVARTGWKCWSSGLPKILNPTIDSSFYGSRNLRLKEYWKIFTSLTQISEDLGSMVLPMWWGKERPREPHGKTLGCRRRHLRAACRERKRGREVLKLTFRLLGSFMKIWLNCFHILYKDFSGIYSSKLFHMFLWLSLIIIDYI